MTATMLSPVFAQPVLIVPGARPGHSFAEPRIHACRAGDPLHAAPQSQKNPPPGVGWVGEKGRARAKLLTRPDRAQAPPTTARPHLSSLTLASGGELLELRLSAPAERRPFALEQRPDQPVGRPQALDVDFIHYESRAGPTLRHVPVTRAAHRSIAFNPLRRNAHRLASSEHNRMPRPWSARLARTQPTTQVQQIFPAPQYDLVARFAPKTVRSQA